MIFCNPVTIIFGCGSRKQLFDFVESNNSILICSESGFARINNDPMLNRIQNKIAETINVDSATDLDVLKTIKLPSKTQTIVAIGGGSVVDSAKIIKYFNNSQSKLICVPTTAGTGSEVTPYATAWDYKSYQKVGFTDLYADTSIVDPEMTYDLPTEFAIASGLDAINQAFESIWNVNNSVITEPLATRAIQMGLSSIVNLEDRKNKNNMCLASLLSGLCISQTKTAICHSISYPLTVRYGIPHGIACAFTMAEVFKYNSDRDDGRLLNLSRTLMGNKSINRDLYNLLKNLCQNSKVYDTVRDKMKSENNLLELLSDMYTPERAKNNMNIIRMNDIRDIVIKSWNS